MYLDPGVSGPLAQVQLGAIDRSNDWEIKHCFARLQFITTFTLQIGNPDRARL